MVLCAGSRRRGWHRIARLDYPEVGDDLGPVVAVLHAAQLVDSTPAVGDTAALLPSTVNAYSTGGVQWAMPFNVSNPVLYYNRKIFTAAGLDPDAGSSAKSGRCGGAALV